MAYITEHACFTQAFYGFLRASEFATNEPIWSDLQLDTEHYSLLIQQSKTDSFSYGHILTIHEIIHESHTSTYPVNAIQQFVNQMPDYQRHGPLFFGGRFTPLNRHKFTATLCTLLQPTGYNEQYFTSHSFYIGASTCIFSHNCLPEQIPGNNQTGIVINVINKECNMVFTAIHCV